MTTNLIKDLHRLNADVNALHIAGIVAKIANIARIANAKSV